MKCKAAAASLRMNPCPTRVRRRPQRFTCLTSVPAAASHGPVPGSSPEFEPDVGQPTSATDDDSQQPSASLDSPSLSLLSNKQEAGQTASADSPSAARHTLLPSDLAVPNSSVARQHILPESCPSSTLMSLHAPLMQADPVIHQRPQLSQLQGTWQR